MQGVINYVDGKMTGESFEYYEQGGILEERHYAEGVRVGKWKQFDSEHNLVEEVVYDNLGHVVDFYRYKQGIRDNSYHFPIIYPLNDSIKRGIENTLFIKIGNVDTTRQTKGQLLITTAFQNNITPIDTLALIDGDNRDGFLYKFLPSSAGKNYVKGILLIDLDGKKLPFKFEYGYDAN